MKRRAFIASGATISLPMFLNGMPVNALARSPLFANMAAGSDRVLVLIQMNGGNDGLNMVLPLDQYSNLSKARPNLLIPENRALKLKDTLGLNPSMVGLQNLYKDGKLTVVHSAGYPNQNRSHFRSKDIWQSGSPADQFWNTGWLGRHFQSQHAEYPENYPNADFTDPFAIAVGNTDSETCQGTITNFALAVNDPFGLNQLASSAGATPPANAYGAELDYLRTSILQTNQYSGVVTSAAKKGKNLATYPTTPLGGQLKNIALMISGGLKTNVYVANLGGFDTHANQVDPTNTSNGQHATLLKTLSDAIAAFQEDLRLQRLEERVVGMTYSEFGRQIRSNNSNGTDHGTAAPLFLFGSCVNKTEIGKNPTISDNVQSQEGVAMQTDFRDIYGSILVDWFDVPETNVKEMLYAGFTKLPILKDCQVATDNEEIIVAAGNLRVAPNPFQENTLVQFRLLSSAFVRISLFDALGSELRQLASQNLGAGDHQISVSGLGLAAGVYYLRIQAGADAQTVRLVKSN